MKKLRRPSTKPKASTRGEERACVRTVPLSMALR